jgi:hypothetical protein
MWKKVYKTYFMHSIPKLEYISTVGSAGVVIGV